MRRMAIIIHNWGKVFWRWNEGVTNYFRGGGLDKISTGHLRCGQLRFAPFKPELGFVLSRVPKCEVPPPEFLYCFRVGGDTPQVLNPRSPSQGSR